MTEDENAKKTFKVKDNRRFDSSGNERDDAGVEKNIASTVPQQAVVQEARPEPIATVESEPAAQTITKPIPAKSPAREAEHAASSVAYSNSASEYPGEIDFSSFVISLATQALMQLGAVKPPPGVEVTIDKGAARQTIDILALLKEKTAGNLDATESQMIEEILHNLKMSFVKLK